MTADILTVALKEWREILCAGGTMRGGRASILILLLMFGIFMPYQFGSEWLNSPGMLVYWAWIPLMIVSGTVADAFAGERERHTLETLLASRLPDRAILLGKVLAAVGYAWGLVLGMLLLGIVTILVTDRGTPAPRVGASVLFWAPLMALLGATLAAGAGVLVSLRAATVRQAAQTLNVAVLLLVFVPVLVTQALPIVWRAELWVWTRRAGVETLLGTIALAMALAAGVLLRVADGRFRRDQLVLD